MPGHRTAFASDVKAHRQLATEELRCCGIAHEGEGYRIAPYRQARGNSGLAPAGKADRWVAGRDERGGRLLQVDIDAISPKCVRKPEPHLPFLPLLILVQITSFADV